MCGLTGFPFPHRLKRTLRSRSALASHVPRLGRGGVGPASLLLTSSAIFEKPWLYAISLDNADVDGLYVPRVARGVEAPVNILLLSRYSRMGASSRLRTMQYLPVLAHHGLSVDVAPFFDDAYLQALYSGQRARDSLGKYIVRRVGHMRRRPAPDLIWLEKEALPWVPWLIERTILPRGVPVVSDYDDAIFHRYRNHPSAPVRALLGRKIDQVMEFSALVMAGNSYLAEHAKRSGARRVEKVPTVVDVEAYDAHLAERNGPSLRVGWIGTPETWEGLAHPIHNLLEPLLSKRGAIFRAIGAGMQPLNSSTLEILPWFEAAEASLIKSMDIGVMPLPDTAWTRGKCGYKLIQYMVCGLPVVASPVGINCEIVEHGVNGFLAESSEEWRTAIDTLLTDPGLRRRMGDAGRRKVEEQYSLQAYGSVVARLLREAAEDGHQNR